MVVINVDGKEYTLNEKHETLMKDIEEAKAIEQGGVHISFITDQNYQYRPGHFRFHFENHR